MGGNCSTDEGKIGNTDDHPDDQSRDDSEGAFMTGLKY
jgi:hypothetical protein